MKDLDKYINNIILEAYSFKSGEDVIDAIKTNNAGVKIDNSYKNALNYGKDEPSSYTLRKMFQKMIRRCLILGINDYKVITYGIQFLLQKANCLFDDDEDGEQIKYSIADFIVNSDGFYEFLKSYKKPWAKDLPEFKRFTTEKLTEDNIKDILHNLEKAIQNEQFKHGKKAKGSGEEKESKTLYDDGTWKLMIPLSFEGEKAIAYYGKKGEKDQPTHWCTRAEKDYYNMYTRNGPLYVIRNFDNGRAYQLAFMDNEVAFLDQDDEDGDEITGGDLTAIPDKLLELIKYKNVSLLDYKKEGIKPSKNKKKNQVSSFELETNPMNPNAKFGKEVEIADGICKKEMLNYSLDGFPINKLSTYFHFDPKTKKRISVEETFHKKDKLVVYYPKNNPKAKLGISIGINYTDKKKNIANGVQFETEEFGNLSPEEKDKIRDIANNDFGITKHMEREKNKITSLPSKTKFIDDVKLKLPSFIKNVNSSNVFKGTNFKELKGFPVPVITRSFIDNNVHIFPKRVVLVDNNGDLVRFIFTNRGTPAAFNKATGFEVYYKNDRDEENEIKKYKTEKDFKDVKKIIYEVIKQIILMPSYKSINDARKIRDAEAVGSLYRPYDEKGINKRPPVYEEVKYFNY